MTKIHIIVGSETGTAIDVAETIEQALLEQEEFAAQNFQVTLSEEPTCADLTRDDEEIFLICTSSTGAGELPGNLIPLYDEMQTAPPRIAGRHYGLITLGDSSYETFGAAGKIMDQAFSNLGATRIGEPLLIDAMETFTPQREALAWVKDWVALLPQEA